MCNADVLTAEVPEEPFVCMAWFADCLAHQLVSMFWLGMSRDEDTTFEIERHIWLVQED